MATATQSVSWAQVSESPLFQRLSPARKVWITAYLGNGFDAFAATRTAYPDVSEKSRRCMAYELRKSQEILDILELGRGDITRAVLMAELRNQLRAAISGSPEAAAFAEQMVRLELGNEPANDSQ